MPHHPLLPSPSEQLLPAPGDGTLVVHYQPIVNLERREVVGAEALVRWHHPEFGLLLPDAFLPAAEGTGAIIPLGLWVLETACRQAASWAEQGLHLEIAVNLSLRQVTDPSLGASVARVLDATGLAPSQLLLEITERSLTDDAEAGPALDELADRGVLLVLDDFGTGHSSLLYLKRFPIAALKIDTTFVAGLGTDRDDEAIVSSVASLAATLGIRCIGEGVETPEQHAQLLALHCQAQGNLFAHAVPAAELPAAVDRAEAVLESHQPTSRRARSRKAAPALPEEVEEQMLQLHRDGASLQTIAAALNRAGAAHPREVRWHSSSVARYLVQNAAQPRAASAR